MRSFKLRIALLRFKLVKCLGFLRYFKPSNVSLPALRSLQLRSNIKNNKTTF